MPDNTDHEQLFKDVIREFFPDFLRLFFAGYAARHDFATVEWLDKELFTDPPTGTVHVLDLVAKLRANEPVAPVPPVADSADPTAWLALVHVEIESPDSTTGIDARLPSYFHHLRRKYGLPVMPAVLYLKVALDGLGVREIEDRYFDFVTNTFRYWYVGLPGLPATDYLRGDNWLGVALSALMRTPKGQRVELGVEAMRRLGEAPISEHHRSLLGDCVETYIDIPEEESERFQGILEENATGRVQPVHKTRFQRGTERGQLLEARAAVRELIEARFGAVPAEVAEAVDAATDRDTLRLWLRTAATAADLATFRAAVGL